MDADFHMIENYCKIEKENKITLNEMKEHILASFGNLNFYTRIFCIRSKDSKEVDHFINELIKINDNSRKMLNFLQDKNTKEQGK